MEGEDSAGGGAGAGAGGDVKEEGLSLLLPAARGDHSQPVLPFTQTLQGQWTLT